jgi:hypothetical protein
MAIKKTVEIKAGIQPISERYPIQGSAAFFV